MGLLLSRGQGGLTAHLRAPLATTVVREGGEPNVVVDASGDTVVDANEDTVVAEDGEPDSLGVPLASLNPDLSVEQWWAGHWANPTADAYIGPGHVRLHANVVNVGALDDLQAAVDGAPDNTTFRLAAGGAYGPVEFYNRSGIHLVAADPQNPPTIADRVGMYADETGYGYFDWVTAVLTDTPPGMQALFLDPPRDVILRDLVLQGDGSATTVPPVNILGYEGVLIERCTITGHVWQDNVGGNTGAPVGHPGLVNGSGGVENVVVRDCTLHGTTNGGGFGYPNASYFDGARGCVYHGNALTGKWHGGGFLLLCNDDFTLDYDENLSVDPIEEERTAKYVAIVGNTSGQQSTRLVSLSGMRTLVAENVVTNTGNMSRFVEIEARCSRLHEAPYNHVYQHYGTVVRDNDVTGANVLVAFVRHGADPGWVCYLDERDEATYAWRGRVGQSTVTGNRVTGTVAAWIADEAGSQAASDGPNTESGNIAGWVP